MRIRKSRYQIADGKFQAANMTADVKTHIRKSRYQLQDVKYWSKDKENKNSKTVFLHTSMAMSSDLRSRMKYVNCLN